jgi:hypothetical protein
MNYTEKNKTGIDSGDAPELKEPVAAYYTGTVENAIAEARKPQWDDDGEAEPLTPERAEEIRNDPAFIAWKEEIIQRVLQGVEDLKTGRDRGRPIEDVWEDLKRRVENGEL